MIIDRDRQAALSRIDNLLSSVNDLEVSVQMIMKAIQESFPHYRWVGVYRLEDGELRLGPYVGSATEHTRIKIGVGVCGMAVKEDRNQVIDDVLELDNYLACSPDTRSEIVVLIRNERGEVIGQIDADGNKVGDFDDSDEAFLMEVASRIAAMLVRC